MTERTPIRSVAILGAGIVGLSAAVAFARALPGLAITLIETPADPAALADRMPGTLPSIATFHERIGLSEADLLAAGATHRIATRLSDWRADGVPVIFAYGERGGPIADGAFHQHWLNARRAGKVAAFDAFSPAAVLGAADRFVHPSDDPASPLSGFGSALRLDPPRYRALLSAYARHLGIVPVAGPFAAIERRADGGVETLLLADGRRVSADLYLDCAGPAAPLRSVIDPQWEDWRAFLPVDRLLLGTAPARAVTPTDDLVAVPAGWRFETPLRDRTLVGLAYTSEQMPDSSARRTLPVGNEIIPIAPGIRPHPWVHNVLAIGDAAVVLDPLADANLHLAQSAILRAIDLLPGRDCAPTELAEYNARTHREAARVRDFQAAHYLATERTRGPFWKSIRHLARPDSLAHTLDQFAHRGRLPFHEDESFDADDWRGLLLGLGMIPQVPDPIAAATPLETVRAALTRMAEANAALPSRLPPYPAYLAQADRRR
ncbi:tryptophan 7-halogenase [Sphingomonas sp. 4RDLI-65]|uniref:tryptophan 7-halogenase n=1 Tax=Sphingomonas sp. 4RDLI-65 TaxID=3111641 RepID=UPI003C29DDFF